MYCSQILSRFCVGYQSVARSLRLQHSKILTLSKCKNLSVSSKSNYGTTVPIDDDIFGFTEDQKQAGLS